jgi:hypothetical protein
MNRKYIFTVSNIKKNVDIKFSAYDAFMEEPSSGTIKVERLKAKHFQGLWEQ